MSITLTNAQMTALSSAAATAARTASSSSASAASATTSSASTGSASSSSNALSSLSSNYNEFLQMFTTQLQDQDPTSPMDSDQFTTELVQFSNVEQQVQTNSNLSQLLQLTQAQDLSSASGLVGKTVSVSGSTVPLENSKAALDFTTTAAEPIAVSITNSAGVDVKDVTLTSGAGANSWTWDGTSNTGAQLADGPYNVSIDTSDASGNITAVPFTAAATPTAVTKNGNSISYSFGATTLDESDITGLSG